MILAAHQPQFAPWLGFFDKIDCADRFVLLDTVQFEKNEWQNRNQIKSANGRVWLTVPVSFRFGQIISQIRICPRENWARRHRKTLEACYRRAAHWESVYRLYDEAVRGAAGGRLIDVNLALLHAVLRELDIRTPLVLASELAPLPQDRDLRLIELCRRLGATTYLAGAGGRSYMRLERWRQARIEVLFQDYHPRAYPQLFGAFEPRLSVLDLLFNCGPDSLEVIRGGRTVTGPAIRG